MWRSMALSHDASCLPEAASHMPVDFSLMRRGSAMRPTA